MPEKDEEEEEEEEEEGHFTVTSCSVLW